MGMKPPIPYAGKDPSEKGTHAYDRGTSFRSGETRTARMDIRMTPSIRVALEATALRTRRTLSSLMDEAIEDIIRKHSDAGKTDVHVRGT